MAKVNNPYTKDPVNSNLVVTSWIDEPKVPVTIYRVPECVALENKGVYIEAGKYKNFKSITEYGTMTTAAIGFSNSAKYDLLTNTFITENNSQFLNRIISYDLRGYTDFSNNESYVYKLVNYYETSAPVEYLNFPVETVCVMNISSNGELYTLILIYLIFCNIKKLSTKKIKPTSFNVAITHKTGRSVLCVYFVLNFNIVNILFLLFDVHILANFKSKVNTL